MGKDYFEWLIVGGDFMVSAGVQRYILVEWGLGGHFLWIGKDGWRYVQGGLRWAGIFYG